MVVKPDAFLVITVTSGVSILIVGLIIALHCPLHALSCSYWCYKIREFFIKLNRRRRKAQITENLVTGSGNGKSYGVTLVEGRPQGHGFYSSGPWTSSTETTSTCISTADNLQKISLLAQLGLFGSTMMGGSSNDNNNSASTSDANGPFYNLSSGGSPSLGIHGDNSSALMTLNLNNQEISTCGNCSGVGFIPTGNPAIIPGQSGIPEGGSEGHQLEEESSSFFDDMDDMDDDADADMIMMM